MMVSAAPFNLYVCSGACKAVVGRVSTIENYLSGENSLLLGLKLEKHSTCILPANDQKTYSVKSHETRTANKIAAHPKKIGRLGRFGQGTSRASQKTRAVSRVPPADLGHYSPTLYQLP